MQPQVRLPFFTLLLMISFASVNAVLFTPALPAIAEFFGISTGIAQQTVTWFLIGYTFGQLIYGPISNRFGRKCALYIGIGLEIVSSLICVLSGKVHWYLLLVIGRFLLALGSGVGLKMTFTLISETLPPKEAAQRTSYVMIAFAITPGLGVMIGGILASHFGWMSTFYFSALYGIFLLVLVSRLPETKTVLDKEALKLDHLVAGYVTQFKNPKLLAGAFLMGCNTSFFYIFAALAPFVGINLLHMTSATYGSANLLPSIGLILGSFFSAQFIKRYSQFSAIRLGVFIVIIGCFMMLIFIFIKASALPILFIPMMIIYFGLSLVLSNASAIALSSTNDKSHGSAVLNFINMGIATIAVLSVGLISIDLFLMPIFYLCITVIMLFLSKIIRKID